MQKFQTIFQLTTIHVTNCGELCKRHIFVHLIGKKCSNLCSLLLIGICFIVLSKQDNKYLYFQHLLKIIILKFLCTIWNEWLSFQDAHLLRGKIKLRLSNSDSHLLGSNSIVFNQPQLHSMNLSLNITSKFSSQSEKQNVLPRIQMSPCHLMLYPSAESLVEHKHTRVLCLGEQYYGSYKDLHSLVFVTDGYNIYYWRWPVWNTTQSNATQLKNYIKPFQTLHLCGFDTTKSFSFTFIDIDNASYSPVSSVNITPKYFLILFPSTP